jgi:hypothetical protein
MEIDNFKVKNAAITKLVSVLHEAEDYLKRPNNDFAWSPWDNAADALREIDSLISRIESGDLPKKIDLEILFAPTGAIQEVSVSSGWGGMNSSPSPKNSMRRLVIINPMEHLIFPQH